MICSRACLKPEAVKKLIFLAKMDVHVMYPCKLWHFLKLGIMNSIKVAYFSSHCIMTEWFVNVFENGEAFNANENKSVTFPREL